MNIAALTNVLMIAALAAIMFSMGLRVKFEEVIASARQPRLVVFGVLANFIFLPLVTVGLLYAFRANAMVSAGFLILAVCPAAPLGPPFTALARGNVSCAIGLMVILSGLSAIASPALLTGLLGYLSADIDLHIDYLVVMRTLVVAQMLPLGIGLAIHHWAPAWTRIERAVSALANSLLVLGIGLILWTQFETLSAVRPRGWIGMLFLLLASLLIGWLCGGPTRGTRKALALTTAIRNAAVGLVIVSASFPGTPAVTALVAYSLVSIFGALGFALVFRKIHVENGQSISATAVDSMPNKLQNQGLLTQSAER